MRLEIKLDVVYVPPANEIEAIRYRSGIRIWAGWLLSTVVAGPLMQQEVNELIQEQTQTE